MPSGVIIYSRLSPCPTDAIKAEPVDKLPDAVQADVKGQYQAPLPARQVMQQPAQKPAVKVTPWRDIVTEANAICVVLKAVSATTCELDVNVFSATVIDATLPTTPDDAKRVCLGIANRTRQPGSPFIGRGWRSGDQRFEGGALI